MKHKNIFIKTVLHLPDLSFQTGAWFFKGIPKYEVPKQRTSASRQSLRDSRLRQDKPVKFGIKCTDTSSEDEDESSTEVDSQKHSPATLNGRCSYDSALSIGNFGHFFFLVVFFPTTQCLIRNRKSKTSVAKSPKQCRRYSKLSDE